MTGNPKLNLEEIRREIESFTASSPENSLGGDFDEPAWGKPLVGVAPGDDTLFLEFREAVDFRHFLPEEVFNLHFPGTPASRSELAVVCWVLPQTEKTREDNRHQDRLPAERWLRNKQMGEAFNDSLRRHVVGWLSEKGIDGVAPVLSPHYGRFISARFGPASSWSERHMAYACGLGTFGLSDGLITPVGKAVRIGSAVVRARVDPVVRPYSDIHEYCLFYRDGSCGACAARCPSGSLRKEGRDKDLCQDYIHGIVEPYAREKYGLESTYACGLCQVGVPCEKGIPAWLPKKNRLE
jgi:epoxyqueuosine reductase